MPIFEDGQNAITLADILAPMTEEEFFKEYYDKKPLHIPGTADKFKGVMDWSILNELLSNGPLWSAKSLGLQIDKQAVPAALYCESREDRSGTMVMQPIAAKVIDLLHQGASLIANDIDMMSKPLRQIAGAFEGAYNGKAQANLYCSWDSRKAFSSHFDTHDVFALHIEGEKTWRVFETRMPHPIRHARHSNGTYTEAQHMEQRGNLLFDVVLKPGDILYLPRGQYHDALAVSSGTVHIALGLVSLVGLDIMDALKDFAVEDEAFRVNLPRLAQGEAVTRSVLIDLGNRIQKLTKDPKVLAALVQYQSSYSYDRSQYTLPIVSADKQFNLAGDQFRLVKDKAAVLLTGPRGSVPIPAGSEGPIAWILANKSFRRGAFLSAHERIPAAAADKLLSDLQAMGVLKPA
ncbi:MAG: cupin domain-containing protein [Alphaproteobacteria bacterium]|nr:cupin domain-containing protein [Alphaproteobacteria bacterium]